MTDLGCTYVLTGTYAVCLDNTIAHLMPKFVQVVIIPQLTRSLI